jgi:hypothetical protein
VVRREGRTRQRAKGKLSRSFFLLRWDNVKRVRVLERCRVGQGEDVDVLVMRSWGSRSGASNGGDVGEGL